MSKQLKQLQTRLSLLESEREVKKIEVLTKQKECAEITKEIGKIKNTISSISTSPIVSEHAILRYLERVNGIDVFAIEKEILSASVLKIIETLGGNGKYPLDNGYKAVIKDNVVVTIID